MFEKFKRYPNVTDLPQFVGDAKGFVPTVATTEIFKNNALTLFGYFPKETDSVAGGFCIFTIDFFNIEHQKIEFTQITCSRYNQSVELSAVFRLKDDFVHIFLFTKNKTILYCSDLVSFLLLNYDYFKTKIIF